MSGWLRGVVARSRGAGAVLRPALASHGLVAWEGGAPPEPPLTPQAETARTVAAAAEPAAPARASPVHAQAEPQPSPAGRLATAEVQASTPPAVRPRLPARVEPPVQGIPWLEAADIEPSPMPARMEHVASGPDDARPAARARTAAAVPPIRPALPVRVGAALPPAAAAARAAQGRAVEAPAPAPDVHIHIGRIELTAHTAPEPRRAAAAPAHKPMSLEDYLGLRNRGTT